MHIDFQHLLLAKPAKPEPPSRYCICCRRRNSSESNSSDSGKDDEPETTVSTEIGIDSDGMPKINFSFKTDVIPGIKISVSLNFVYVLLHGLIEKSKRKKP